MYIQERISALDAYVSRQEGRLEAAELRKQELETELQETKDLCSELDKAVALLNSIGESRQLAVKQQIEYYVTRGLQLVFSPELSFHIELVQKAKTTNARFFIRTTLEDGSIIETSVLNARGGGLVASVSFFLEIVILMLTIGDKPAVIFQDEPFAHLSKDLSPSMAAFIRELVDNTNIQVVLVTHDEAFVEHADCVYKLKIRDGKTKAERL